MQAVARRYAGAEARAFVALTVAMRNRRTRTEVEAMRRAGTLYAQEDAALAEITPPPRVAQDHRILVASYRTAARWAAAVAASLKNPSHTNPADVRNTWQPPLEAALHDLHAKGYEVGDFVGVAERLAGAAHH